MNEKEGLVRGYKVKKAVCFKNGVGFAVGENRAAPFPFATWQFAENKGQKTFQNGKFFTAKDADMAGLVFGQRVEKYRKDNPGLGEKYNQLAAAEMSSEGNYNMIDGIPNNGFEQKPSILDMLREYNAKPPALPDKSDKLDKSAKPQNIEL